MKEFENCLVHGIHKSRYVASWVKSGGGLDYEVVKDSTEDIDIVNCGKFMRWLQSLGLTEEEARDVRNYAENGKLELEESAKAFLKENK